MAHHYRRGPKKHLTDHLTGFRVCRHVFFFFAMLCKSAAALASPVRVDHPAADISNGMEVCREQQCHRSYRHLRRGVEQSHEGLSSCMALS